jgi:hypothetical protein
MLFFVFSFFRFIYNSEKTKNRKTGIKCVEKKEF